MKTVIICGTGYSGSGAISDYLKAREDFYSPFKDQEFRIINDPYGIENLFQNFYVNFSINNCSEAIYNFVKFSNEYNSLNAKYFKSKNVIYGKNFSKLTENYLNKIIFLKYQGIPQFKRISLGIKQRMLVDLHIKLNKYTKAPDIYNMCLPVEKNVFIKETKKYLYKIINFKNVEKKNIILDQSTNFWRPSIVLKYFDNPKIIRVSRDPRSIYSSFLKNSPWSYPSKNINLFIKWYSYIIENKYLEKNNKEIIDISFEEFVLNFKNSQKKINRFLKIKNKKSVNFNLSFSQSNVFKAKKFLKKRDQRLIEKKLKKYLIWEKYLGKINVS